MAHTVDTVSIPADEQEISQLLFMGDDEVTVDWEDVMTDDVLAGVSIRSRCD
jgi:hypothetical protein